MAAKKTFVEDLNPALAFIGTQKTGAAPEMGADPDRFVFQAQSRETKSRRLQLLVKPSTHAALKGQADRAGTSLNAYINAILEYHAGKSGHD